MTAVLDLLSSPSPFRDLYTNALLFSNLYSTSIIVLSALQDTRTHVVVELYDTERSYVEALQILVNVSTFIARLTEKQIADQRIFRKTHGSSHISFGS